MIKKVLTWAVIAFIVFYIVRSPGAAAANVKAIGNGIAHIASQFGDFLANLVR